MRARVGDGELERVEDSFGDFETGCADAIDPLTGLLAEHNMKEERILYPRSDAALSAAERRELIRRTQSL